MRIPIFLCALAAAGTPRAQSSPAPVSTGPLVCFTTNARTPDATEVTLHIAELDGTGPSRPFWRNSDNANVLARLDRDHLLLTSYGSPYALLVVDLAAGTHRVLAAGAPHGFVAVHGADVLFLGDPRGDTPDNFLYAAPWATSGERRRLAAQRFDHVREIAGNLAVGIAPDANAAEVWVISIVRASGRAVWSAPAGTRALRTALSPGGQRLAIGCVLANGESLLTVVDLGAGTVVRSWSDLPIQVSPLSSSMPCLEVGWHDDDHVVCSETRGDRQGMRGSFVHVRRCLTSGETTDENVYDAIGLAHRPPPPPGAGSAAQTAPTFVTEIVGATTRLTRTGSSEPLATFDRAQERYGDVRVAPDGQSAVAHLGEGKNRCTLFTATSKDGRLLSQGSAYDFVWLPARAPAR